MYKWLGLAGIIVLGALLFACGDDDDSDNGGGDTDSDTDTEGDTDFFVDGCDMLEEYCLDRLFWVAYGITSSAVCQDTFLCTNEFYEGDQECQDMVAATLDCAADISAESECEECEDLAAQVSANCDYPEGCM